MRFYPIHPLRLSFADAAPVRDLFDFDIPCEKHTLENGLTLLMHQDRKAPIVAVNVWYHVGSKDERPGKTGFAHLFEHLMFNGSEHHDDDYFAPLEQVGATNLNGTTSQDRTNYFQNVPTSAVDTALWMESDRMGHLLGALTQAKLDEQRGVVQNEKRQSENQPYGRVREIIAENTYPQGHPYSWTVIGRMEDLDAATLDDAREWFNTYYGAANAVLSVAGDIDFAAMRGKVEAFFGAVPPGPPLAKRLAWVARRQGVQRQRLQDRVPQARVYKVWNTPEWGAADSDWLSLTGGLLSTGKSSRLYKRLVMDDQVATDVSAYVASGEIGSQFSIVATAKPGESLAALESALDDELARFLEGGPRHEELERIKTYVASRFIRGLESIGGFGGKSDILARSQVFGGRPDAYKDSLKRTAEATAESIRSAAQRWLSDGAFILEVEPYGSPKARAASSIDRSKLPTPGDPPVARFPRIQRAELSNGMKIMLAERHETPLAVGSVMIDAGFAADAPDSRGTASLAMSVLDEGTASRTALEIADESMRLGAVLSATAGIDTCSLSLSALRANLAPSLGLLADILLNPSFPEKEFARLKKQRLAGIRQEMSRPGDMALRVFPRFVFGADHPYGGPLSGTGSEASVAAIGRAALAEFHRRWFNPRAAVALIAGDTTLDEVVPMLESLTSEWSGGAPSRKDIALAEPPARRRVYLLDQPGASQATICAGHVAPPATDPDHVAISAMNHILGGAFSSRINMNLREEKHWTYGARATLHPAARQRLWIARTSVQIDKAAEAMAEIDREIREFLERRPPTESEVGRARDNLALRLPGSWETAAAVADAMRSIALHGWPDDYYDAYPAMIRGLTVETILAAAHRTLLPDRAIWVVVGDREKIEEPVRALGFGDPMLVDADGDSLR
ncbi:MAG: Peptidase M16 inactive domain protein [candidate division BRC1 bacterium ADurb.BinA364]|nr:MAG: Peptidase M16 inactive domain protein [candidate division BRC1 bacterium ADurb.BinA364]